jgi:adenylate kinase family enzyme
MRKIAVIGNGGGGKTTLSRELGRRLNLPVTHVDSIQFLAGMKVRPTDETRKILNDLAAGERWLIDGFGPFDVMEQRFALADRIVFVDFPLWRHYWWATKRQVTSLYKIRGELPAGCSEAGLRATWTMYKALWRVHWKIRPKLLAIFSRVEIAAKMTVIHNLAEWNRCFSGEL